MNCHYRKRQKQKSESAIKHITEKCRRLSFALKGFLISIHLIMGIVEWAAEKFYEGVKMSVWWPLIGITVAVDVADYSAIQNSSHTKPIMESNALSCNGFPWQPLSSFLHFLWLEHSCDKALLTAISEQNLCTASAEYSTSECCMLFHRVCPFLTHGFIQHHWCLFFNKVPLQSDPPGHPDCTFSFFSSQICRWDN